ncbi:MAG: hypothetical protein ABIJ48_06250 [Actinomycetota bacterium]
MDDLNAVLRRLVEFVNPNARFGLLALKIEEVTLGETSLYIPTVAGTVSPPPPREGKKFIDLLPTAPAASQEVVRRLDEVAAQRGWTWSDKVTRQYYRSQGGFLIRYDARGALSMNIGRLRDHGLTEEAATIRNLLGEIEGKTVPAKWPELHPEGLLAHWDRFTQEFIPAYEQALEQYYGTGGTSGA